MDIALNFSQSSVSFDWTIANSAVSTGDDLQTAIAVSLFTDARDLPYDRYGWFGDTFLASPVGSRLNELTNATVTNKNATLTRAKDLTGECLQWLIDENIVASFDITTSFAQNTSALRLLINITANKPINFWHNYRLF